MVLPGWRGRGRSAGLFGQKRLIGGGEGDLGVGVKEKPLAGDIELQGRDGQDGLI
jgi:hypothetical protein